jgi:hypothetical protein
VIPGAAPPRPMLGRGRRVYTYTFIDGETDVVSHKFKWDTV